MTAYATKLFAAPSFLRGAARVLDMGGTMNIYNDSLSEKEADSMAIGDDWNAVGLALAEAIGRYKNGEAKTR